MMSLTLFFLFIPLLTLALLAINLIFAPHKPYQEKNSVFECGYHSFLGQNRTQFNISFFIFALLFLLFDLEILLVYPYIVSAYNNAIYGLFLMLIFFLMLTLGFAFELGKNALSIETRQSSDLESLDFNTARISIFYMQNNIAFWAILVMLNIVFKRAFYSVLSEIKHYIITNIVQYLMDIPFTANFFCYIILIKHSMYGLFPRLLSDLNQVDLETRNQAIELYTLITSFLNKYVRYISIFVIFFYFFNNFFIFDIINNTYLHYIINHIITLLCMFCLQIVVIRAFIYENYIRSNKKNGYVLFCINLLFISISIYIWYRVYMNISDLLNPVSNDPSDNSGQTGGDPGGPGEPGGPGGDPTGPGQEPEGSGSGEPSGHTTEDDSEQSTVNEDESTWQSDWELDTEQPAEDDSEQSTVSEDESVWQPDWESDTEKPAGDDAELEGLAGPSGQARGDDNEDPQDDFFIKQKRSKRKYYDKNKDKPEYISKKKEDSKKYYEENKHKPEYIEKRKESCKRYREKNKNNPEYIKRQKEIGKRHRDKKKDNS